MRTPSSFRLLLRPPQSPKLSINPQTPLIVQSADTSMDVIGKLRCCSTDRSIGTSWPRLILILFTEYLLHEYGMSVRRSLTASKLRPNKISVRPHKQPYCSVNALQEQFFKGAVFAIALGLVAGLSPRRATFCSFNTVWDLWRTKWHWDGVGL